MVEHTKKRVHTPQRSRTAQRGGWIALGKLVKIYRPTEENWRRECRGVDAGSGHERPRETMDGFSLTPLPGGVLYPWESQCLLN